MTRVLIFLMSLLLVTSCGRRNDVEIRKNLPGVWHFVSSSPNANDPTSIFTIAPNGDFTNRVISPKGDHIVDVIGSFQVEDGYLIGTVTQQDSQTRHVSRAKIYQASANEMVIAYEGTTNLITLKKDISSQVSSNAKGALPGTFQEFLAQNAATEKSGESVQTLVILAIALLVALAVVGRWLLR